MKHEPHHEKTTPDPFLTPLDSTSPNLADLLILDKMSKMILTNCRWKDKMSM